MRSGGAWRLNARWHRFDDAGTLRIDARSGCLNCAEEAEQGRVCNRCLKWFAATMPRYYVMVPEVDPDEVRTIINRAYRPAVRGEVIAPTLSAAKKWEWFLRRCEALDEEIATNNTNNESSNHEPGADRQ